MVTIKNGSRLQAVFGEGRNCIEVLAGVQDSGSEIKAAGQSAVAFMLPAGTRPPKVGTMGSIGDWMVKILEAKQGPIDGMVELLVEYCGAKNGGGDAGDA